MHYKTNRLNHDFQIAYFIAGSCHTPDAAYAILCDLHEDRSNALRSFAAGRLREKAKRRRAEKILARSNELMEADDIAHLEAQADLLEMQAFEESARKNHAAALAELATIEKCMTIVHPLRKFKHLPDPEAHEAAQAEEWKLELIFRAENCLLTTGTIPTDQFSLMRLHPAFESEILPAISEIRYLMSQPDGQAQLLARASQRKFDLPKLLQLSSLTPK